MPSLPVSFFLQLKFTLVLVIKHVFEFPDKTKKSSNKKLNSSFIFIINGFGEIDLI